MTGWRLGAAIGPKNMVEKISQFNVNDESCTTQFVQWAGVAALEGPLDEYRKMMKILKERRDAAVDLLNSMKGVHVSRPESTFYLYPNVTEAMSRLGVETVEEFREKVLEETGVSFTTRNHFGSPLEGETQSYIRLAYSGIGVDDIREGLSRMKDLLDG